MIPYAVKGVIWYQGEADGSIIGGLRYRQQLPTLINDWRKRWGNDQMSFVVIQLPYWKAATSWMTVREAQLKALELPFVGLVVTLDIGDPNDVHPNDKSEVGRRAALWALAEVYAQKVMPSGPIPLGLIIHRGKRDKEAPSIAYFEGDSARVPFQYGEGLNGNGGAIKGFFLAGKDRKWFPAQVRVDGYSIIATSKDVPEPIALRYAWDGNPDNCNLHNKAGLPASPFRTDDWDLK